MADFERLISSDIDPKLVRRVLDDEFVRGHVELVLHIDSGQRADQTLVVPVFNQPNFIERCLRGIADNISAASDLVVVLDCCTDESETTVLASLKGMDRFSRTTVLRTKYPIYETRCDNLGFLLSRGDYVIEVQSDIEILTAGFDRLLQAPMVADPGIFSTSGRGGHWFGLLIPKRERRRRFPIRNLMWQRLRWDRVGYTGKSGAHANGETAVPGRYAQAETVMRGPWCLRRRDLLLLGLLDEQNFFLGNDDHDLHARARLRNLRCAYVPIAFESPLDVGLTRKERSGVNAEAYGRLKQRPSKGYLSRFLESYRPTIPCRYVRNRR